jgi:hypothetical protein
MYCLRYAGAEKAAEVLRASSADEQQERQPLKRATWHRTKAARSTIVRTLF